MRKYISLMRIDHWIKNVFVLPGIAFALLLTEDHLTAGAILALLSTCFIASANYVINEYLDAPFDREHPVKKTRAAAVCSLSRVKVAGLYISCCLLGFFFGGLSGKAVFLTEAVLLLMGLIYNVPPVRSKEVPVADVLSESVNSALRFLIGWFSVTKAFLPPVSIVLGYWMGGAFLMDVKRLSELRMIGDRETAGRYRRSFRYYSTELLTAAALFYSMAAVFFLGIFLVKYRIEFLLLMPFVFGLFCRYLYMAYAPDSSAQAPEKLYREKGLIIYVAFLCILFMLLLKVDMPWLGIFTKTELVAL